MAARHASRELGSPARTPMRALRPLVLALVALTLAADASAWWDKRWSHRRKLSFDNSGQPENLANFPVLIVLNSSRIDYGKTRAGGIDIRFVDSNDQTLLSHEIERWSAGGTSYVWVRVPQIDASSSDDFIWMYYGNPTAPNAENIPFVWSPGFVMVHHLNETVSDGNHVDSATNDGANDASAILVQAQGTATGMIDGADSLVRPSNHRVEVPDSPSLDMAAGDSFTVEAWGRTSFSAGYQMAYSKESRGNPGDGEIQLWTDNGTASFWLNDGAGNTARVGSAANVADDQWHYLVGRWNEATGFAEIFVDGVNVSVGGGETPGTLGAIGTITPAVIGDEGDDSGGGGVGEASWAGLLDEIRVSKVLRSDNWIKAQNQSMRDNAFVLYGAEAAHCCGLGVSEAGSTITITAPGRFEAIFDKLRGGGLASFYDLEEDPGRAYDLAGKPASNFHGLFHSSITSAATLYTTGTNGDGAELDLLEATPVRVRVRQEAFYQRVPPGTAILPGVKATGDYSVYAESLALGWSRTTTADLPESDHPLEIGVRRELAPDPRSNLSLYSQTDGVFPNPAGDDFVLAQREAPGVRTDFLAILSADWPAADTLTAATTAAYFSWRDNVTVSPVPVGTTQSWRLQIHFKPTSFLDHLDPAVTSRSADYRLPAALTINGAKGSRWSEASENTAAAGDWFNEAEAAYVLDLDPALGLDFDISGSGPSPRYRPFFKIRQWRSFAETPVVTLEGAPLVKSTDYRAAVKPMARAHFEKDVTWYSTLEDAAAVATPDVGTSATVVGADFPATPPFRHGRAARFDTDGEYIQVPTAGNFNPAEGTIEFWYLPEYEFGTGVLTDDMAFFGYEIDANNSFQAYHQPGSTAPDGLKFLVRSGGAVHVAETGGVGISPVLWRANDWVHLRFVWDNAPQRLEVYLNGRLVVSSASYAAPVGAAPNLYVGDRQVGGFVNNAQGRIDEFRIYDTADSPTELAHGGLAADVREHLSTSSRNYTFTFAQEDANHRGEYLYLGADAKFRGLNVSLEIPGVGTGLDLEWQYWDGSGWIDLETTPGFTDQTNHLTQAAGTIFWTSDPTAWAPYSLRGGPDLYYVRARLQSGSYSGQFPRENAIKTDILLFQHCHDITAAAQTFVFAVPPTTEVRLSSFTATPGDSSVLVEWRTASELRNLGFHLYRAPSADGPWMRLTTSLIPGLGSSAVGQAYSYSDAGLVNGTRYYYRLDDVDASSKTTSHGPVSAVPQAGATAPGDPGANAGRDETKGASATSCPAWVLAAYGSAAGSAAELSSLRCTRHGDPEATSLAVLSRDSRQATVELRTGGFYALHEGGGTVRVFVPGFDVAQDEEALALPLRRALVEAMVGRRVALGGVRALELVSFRGLVPSALGKAEMQVGWDGTVRAARRGLRETQSRGGSSRQAARFPRSELATLLPSLFQGETKSAVVEIAPLRFDAQRRQLLLAKRVRVKLLFSGREAGESGRGSLGRAPRARKPAVTGEVLARLHTTSPGLHAVSFEELFAGQRRGVSVSGLRLERQGEAVAFHVEPQTGTFGAGSRLFFYAAETAGSTAYSAELAYELVSGEGVPMPLVSGAPGPNAVGTPSSVTRWFETNRFYQPGLLEAEDVWLWEAASSGATRAVSFALAGVSAAGTAELDVFLQGASESGHSVDHHVSVSVNGVPVGEAQFAGKKPYRMSLRLPASLLREGANELGLSNVADTGVTSLVFLDRFTLVHPQWSSAAGGRFEGAWPESGTATVSGIFGAAAVVELTASSASGASGSSPVPRWLSGSAAVGDTVSFQAEAGRTYLVVSQPLVPRVSRPEPTTLRATANQADYLLIAPRAFLTGAEPLVARRQDQGLTTKAVSFEEVAQAFGDGEPSAEAIRSFVSYAFHSWARPSPRYVLLLGDSSYDPRNFSGVSQPSPLPSLWTKTSYLWTASDPLLAAVNGEDGLPDLSIGRLPATTVQQAEALVAKLIAWEDSGQGLGGAAALVADNPDLAGDFEADVRDIAESYLQDRAELLYLSEHGAGLRPRIQGALDGGLSHLSYVGHGGAAVWASENVWNSWDAESLQAQSTQPLLLTLNCLNGYFVAPTFESLAESLIKAEGRGAIASVSPSGLSLDGPAHQYHRALMAELVSGRHQRLGDAVLAAQKTYAETGLMPELMAIYHLLGDPAMRIR